jgi:hypothetical protein
LAGLVYNAVSSVEFASLTACWVGAINVGLIDTGIVVARAFAQRVVIWFGIIASAGKHGNDLVIGSDWVLYTNVIKSVWLTLNAVVITQACIIACRHTVNHLGRHFYINIIFFIKKIIPICS